jgi:hypothetical protein
VLLTSLRTLPGLLAAVALAAAALAQAPGVTVENWAEQPIGKKGVPSGWQKQNWGSPKYDFTVVADGEGRALHMRSENESSTITKEIKVDLGQDPVLEWRWKVAMLPKGGDSRNAKTDDQAAQVYVVFPRFPSALRSTIIGYVWDTTAPAGTIVKSQKTGTVTYLVVRSGAAELGRWVTETRNVLEDYQRIHGGAPDVQPGAIAIGIDTNDTHTRAESYIGHILFRKP